MTCNMIVKFVILSLCHVNRVLSLVRLTTIDNGIPRILLQNFFTEDLHLLTSPQIHGSCLGVYQDETSCLLTLEARRPKNSSDDLLTCNFNLPSPKNWILNKHDKIYRRAATITKDKALLVQSQGCNHKWYALHFSTCTVMHLTSIRACDWAFFLQVPLEDTLHVINPQATRLFDVMLDGSNRVMLRRLRVPFDTLKWRPPIINGNNAFFFSTTKGRLFVESTVDPLHSSFGAIKISTVDDNGMNRTLKEYNYQYDSVYMSVTNELLTACIPIKRLNFTCIQFNSDGDVNFEIQLKNPWFGIYEINNLPGGGLIGIFEDCLDDSCEKKILTVKKFDRTGNMVETSKTTNFKCRRHYRHFFEKENGEQCLSQICPKNDEFDDISLELICFDKEDYIHENSTKNIEG